MNVLFATEWLSNQSDWIKNKRPVDRKEEGRRGEEKGGRIESECRGRETTFQACTISKSCCPITNNVPALSTFSLTWGGWSPLLALHRAALILRASGPLNQNCHYSYVRRYNAITVVVMFLGMPDFFLSPSLHNTIKETRSTPMTSTCVNSITIDQSKTTRERKRIMIHCWILLSSAVMALAQGQGCQTEVIINTVENWKFIHFLLT